MISIAAETLFIVSRLFLFGNRLIALPTLGNGDVNRQVVFSEVYLFKKQLLSKLYGDINRQFR